MGYSCVLLVQVCHSLDEENSPEIFHNPLIISVFDVAVKKRALLLFVEAQLKYLYSSIHRTEHSLTTRIGKYN